MCIAIVTTEHPQYPFILLSNRDEYLQRPTAAAQWWDPPNSQVLGGFDLLRDVRGTWLGVTRQGRIAVLTNFREEGEAIIQGARSRGEIVNDFLKTPPGSAETIEEAASRLVESGVSGVGGFSLIFGQLQDVAREGRKGLAIVSNRTPEAKDVIWLAGSAGETHALSNSHFGDLSWPKVTNAEAEVKLALKQSVAQNESKDALLERLFKILSIDTLPRRNEGEEWEPYLRNLRRSIFVPVIGDADLDSKANSKNPNSSSPINGITCGLYGTQKQSIILVDNSGQMTFVERSLLDNEGKPVETASRDRYFEFQIEGWNT